MEAATGSVNNKAINILKNRIKELMNIRIGEIIFPITSSVFLIMLLIISLLFQEI